MIHRHKLQTKAKFQLPTVLIKEDYFHCTHLMPVVKCLILHKIRTKNCYCYLGGGKKCHIFGTSTELRKKIPICPGEGGEDLAWRFGSVIEAIPALHSWGPVFFNPQQQKPPKANIYTVSRKIQTQTISPLHSHLKKWCCSQARAINPSMRRQMQV